MAKLDEVWLAVNCRTVRSTEPPRELYERLKIFSSLIAEVPVGAGGKPRLLWRDEPGKVRSLELPGKLVIGRDVECGLQFSDSRVSRRHCEITLLRGVAWVADLESTNGTCVNGVRLNDPAPLREGDIITIGSLALGFTA